MKSFLARENSIWNMMFYGKPQREVRRPNEKAELTIDKELAFDKESIFDKESTFDNESTFDKESLISEKQNGGYLPIKVQGTSKSRKVVNPIYIFLTTIALIAIYLVNKDSINSTAPFPNLTAGINLYKQGFADSGSSLKYATEELDSKPREIIAVSFPTMESPLYGSPVHSSLLINHTFGESWGHPASGNLSVPAGLKFNKVVLTLNTSVSGVQYDRLANIFVDGVQVWRTSTAEPGGRSVYSSYNKDVSEYSTLFAGNSTVLFQLDNLLTPRLTGSFDVQLYVTFYDSEAAISSEPINSFDRNSSTHSIFSRANPAARILSLTNGSGLNVPSVRYLPSDKINVNLPTFSQNTTRLSLAIFTSGNAAEEFWYTDVLSQYSHIFDKYGTTLQGRSPVRIVNVYFNGEKIATQTPQPFIFTGGISPSLWSPVVAIDAFDLPALEIDLTPLLPVLWSGSSSIADKFLEIEVSNGYDELTDNKYPQCGIAENWITSANLLSYESKLVANATGNIDEVSSDIGISTIAFNPPFSGIYEQIIGAKANASITSSLNFTLIDGTTFNTTVTEETKVKLTNVQNYVRHGFKQNIVHVGNSKKATTFLDASSPQRYSNLEKVPSLAPNTIYQVNVSKTYPVIISSVENSRMAPEGEIVDYDIKISLAKDLKLAFNGAEVLKEKVRQNGTSTFTITPSGNYGTGNLTTKFKAQAFSPMPLLDYKRDVTVCEGNITKDVVSGGYLDTPRVEEDYDLLLSSIFDNEFTIEHIKNAAKVANVEQIYELMEDFGSNTMPNEKFEMYPPPKEKNFRKHHCSTRF